MHPLAGVALACLASAVATIIVVFLLLIPGDDTSFGGITDVVAFGDSCTDESRCAYADTPGTTAS